MQGEHGVPIGAVIGLVLIMATLFLTSCVFVGTCEPQKKRGIPESLQ